MKYRKIRVEFKQAPNRLYREFYANESLALDELGIIITTLLGAMYSHSFMFSKEKEQYVPYCFLTGPLTPYDRYMGDYKYIDLGNKFEYTYDTGENYTFDVIVSDKSININKKTKIIDVSGAGLGIWEDNIVGLYNYLDNKVRPGTIRKGENDPRFPWNINILCLKNWDSFPQDAIDFLTKRINKDMKVYKAMDLKSKSEALENLEFYKQHKEEIDAKYFEMESKLKKILSEDKNEINYKS